MVIKPHLAITFAVYTIVSRRWGTVLVARVTVAVTSIFATLLLGQGIWAALLGGIKEAQVLLEHGLYPLFRMVSIYAAFRTIGVPATIAIAFHVFAVLALLMVCFTSFRSFTLQQSLGLTAIGSLLRLAPTRMTTIYRSLELAWR